MPEYTVTVSWVLASVTSWVGPFRKLKHTGEIQFKPRSEPLGLDLRYAKAGLAVVTGYWCQDSQKLWQVTWKHAGRACQWFSAGQPQCLVPYVRGWAASCPTSQRLAQALREQFLHPFTSITHRNDLISTSMV